MFMVTTDLPKRSIFSMRADPEINTIGIGTIKKRKTKLISWDGNSAVFRFS